MGAPDVVIADIHYNCAVKRTQADEYVEIVNRGPAPADISGWTLFADDPGQNFAFPPNTPDDTMVCRDRWGQYVRADKRRI